MLFNKTHQNTQQEDNTAFSSIDNNSSSQSVSHWILITVVSLLATLSLFMFLFHRCREIFRNMAFIDWVESYKIRSTTISSKIDPNDSQRPPIVQGFVCFGNALQFYKNTAAFLHHVAEKYGEMAQLRLLNRYVVVLTDIHSFQKFCRENKFDFRPIINQVNQNVFGFSVKTTAVDEHRKKLVQYYRSVKINETVVLFDRHLNRRLDCYLVRRGVEVKLNDFIIQTGFLAIFQTLVGTKRAQALTGDDSQHYYDIMGKEYEATKFYSSYSTFSHYFNYLWLGLPLRIFPAAYHAFSSLTSLHPSAADVVSSDDACPYIYMAYQLMKKNGHNDQDFIRHSIELVHVHANIIRLAYWILVYTLSDEVARKAVIDEIDELVTQKRALCGESLSALHFDLEDIESLHNLDAVFKETLRLVSGVVVIRCVTQDTHFTTSNKTYFLKRGDTVLFYPPAHHWDPEIFPEPHRFVWDRFFEGTFFKNGEPIEKALLGFGSLCIGQRFAMILAKWYIIQLFQRFTMHLTGPVPCPKTSYQIHEILEPVDDSCFLTYEPRPGALDIKISPTSE